MVSRIAFDARMAEHSGIGTYIRGLCEALATDGGAPESFEFHFLGPPEILERYWFFSHWAPIRPVHAPLYGVKERLFFPKSEVYDAYHFPHYNVPWRLRRPFFVTIHDLIHLLYPEVLGSRAKWLYAAQLLRHAAKKATRILTVSEASKTDIINELEVPEEKIVVTPCAVSPHWQPRSDDEVERARAEFNLPSRFVLAVGINKPHKNFQFLIRAFAQWHKTASEHVQLALCGLSNDDRAELRRFAAEQDASDCVHFVGYLPHGSLPSLYQASEALIFPSTYEGFGLPVLEAQRLGVPVIASNASSIPEVAGYGALYFNPESPEELRARLDEFYEDDYLAQQLVAKGHANEQLFSWQNTARLTLETYAASLGTTPQLAGFSPASS